eukprot:jgi/Phyca11/97069/e_gw1.1.1644.1
MLSRSGHPFFCPVFGALILLQARKGLPAGIPAISTVDVSNIIKAAANRIDKDPRRFCSHSLHSGGATHMYRTGIEALTIQFHGRWVSDAYKTYR